MSKRDTYCNIHEVKFNKWQNEVANWSLLVSEERSFTDLMSKALNFFFEYRDITTRVCNIPIKGFEKGSKFSKKFYCDDETEDRIAVMVEKLEIYLSDLCWIALLEYGRDCLQKKEDK